MCWAPRAPQDASWWGSCSPMRATNKWKWRCAVRLGWSIRNCGCISWISSSRRRGARRCRAMCSSCAWALRSKRPDRRRRNGAWMWTIRWQRRVRRPTTACRPVCSSRRRWLMRSRAGSIRASKANSRRRCAPCPSAVWPLRDRRCSIGRGVTARANVSG